MTPSSLLGLFLLASLPAGMPSAPTPRLAALVELSGRADVLLRTVADAQADEGLLVIQESPARADGTDVLLPVVLYNGSGRTIYHASILVEQISSDGRSGRPTTVSVEPGDRGLGPGELSSSATVRLPQPTAQGHAFHRLRGVAGISYVRGIGGYGTSSGELSKPRGIAVDGDRLIVADRGNNRIQVFGLDGAWRAAWGGHGTEPGRFDHLEDVAVDHSTGEILACDMNNSRIQVIGRAGEVVSILPRGGTGLNRPSDIGLSPDGREVFVLDAAEFRVFVMSRSGEILRGWGAFGEGAGQFRAPLDLEVGDDGRVYVSDAANQSVQVFSSDGRLLTTVTGSIREPLLYPSAVVPLPQERLLIADFAEDRIRLFELSPPREIDRFGRAGHVPGSLHYPADVKVHGDLLFVSETASNRISAFDLSRWQAWSTAPKPQP